MLVFLAENLTKNENLRNYSFENQACKNANYEKLQIDFN